MCGKHCLLKEKKNTKSCFLRGIQLALSRRLSISLSYIIVHLKKSVCLVKFIFVNLFYNSVYL